MPRGLLWLSLLVTVVSMAEEKKPVKCLDVSAWINSCVDRVSKGEAQHRSTLVDIRFLGKKMPAMTDRWVRDNSGSILEDKGKMDFSKESSRTVQEGCVKITSAQPEENSLIMQIEKSDENFVEVSLHDPKTENPDDSGLAALILRDFRIRMTKKSDNELVVTLREPKDGRLMETDQLIRCAATLPAEDKPAPALKAFQDRAASIKADASEIKEDPKDLPKFAFMTRSGEPMYMADRTDEHKAEYQSALDVFAKDKNKVIKELNTEEHTALYLEFVKTKGKSISPEALFALHTEMTGNRMLVTPKNEAELVKDKPELKKQFADMRANMKKIQKEIAQILDMPDYYWDYPDVPNNLLDTMINAIGGALNEALDNIGEKLGEAIKEELEKAPKP